MEKKKYQNEPTQRFEDKNRNKEQWNKGTYGKISKVTCNLNCLTIFYISSCSNQSLSCKRRLLHNNHVIHQRFHGANKALMQSVQNYETVIIRAMLALSFASIQKVTCTANSLKLPRKPFELPIFTMPRW